MWQLVRNERDRPAVSKVGKVAVPGVILSVGLQQAATASCGIAVAESVAASARQAVSELKAKLSGDFQHVMVFFSRNYNASELASAFESEFAGIPVSACSTAGGIGPSGMIEKGIVAIAFPREGFRIHTGLIEDVGSFGVERASSIVHRLKTQLSERAGQKLRDRVFGLMLVDGLSEAEEPLVAAVHWAFDDMQLIGGSSGDGLMFEKTALIHEGRVLSRAAILMMIESEFPFRIFKTDNFEATPVKFVVTAANAEHRVVHELNAEVAAREYASSIGLMLDDLSPLSFASYPLVVKVGGDYYCRSIRNVNADGSLSFYCAIDEGLVFTLARLKRHAALDTAEARGSRHVARRHRHRARLRMRAAAARRRKPAGDAADGRSLQALWRGRISYLRRATQRDAFEPDFDGHSLWSAARYNLMPEEEPAPDYIAGRHRRSRAA